MAELETTTGRRWLYAAVLGFAAFVLLTWWVRRTDGPTVLDQRVLSSVVDTRTAPVNLAAAVVTSLGSTVGVIIAAAALALSLSWRTRSLRLPLVLTVAVVETAAIVFLIKEVVARERPPVRWLIGTPAGDPAFPSGHTTNGTVVWLLGMLFVSTTLVRRWSRAVLIATGTVTSLAIGLSRIYLGYHWTTDVLGGWLLALAVCGTAAYVVRRFHPAPADDDASPRPLPAARVRSRS